MLFREIVIVCSRIHTKHINTAWAERWSSEMFKLLEHPASKGAMCKLRPICFCNAAHDVPPPRANTEQKMYEIRLIFYQLSYGNMFFRNNLYYYNTIYSSYRNTKYRSTNRSSISRSSNYSMLGFVGYRFRNRKVKYWFTVRTWQNCMCLEVLLLLNIASFTHIFHSQSNSATFKILFV